MKLMLAVCLGFCLALGHVNANCSGDCPDTEDVVWALGGDCQVFRNKCYFDKENCVRKPALTVSTKEECQKHCSSVCTQQYAPVTGTYRGEVKSFGNSCAKLVHSCQTGETFLD